MLLEVGRSKVDEKYSDQARIENCKCQPGLCQKPRAAKSSLFASFRIYLSFQNYLQFEKQNYWSIVAEELL
jgi:hypothetical protein